MKQERRDSDPKGLYIILTIWALTTIYPIIWVIMNSFKAKDKILSNSFALPTGDLFTLANYRKAFSNLNIFSAYRNSLVISGTVAAVVVIIAGMAAYALCRYEFRGKKLLSTLVVAGMMFPVFATIIPVYRMETGWGITNTESWPLTMLSIILPSIAGNLSFAIIVLRRYISTLPVELEEAAYLEGCSTLQLRYSPSCGRTTTCSRRCSFSAVRR